MFLQLILGHRKTTIKQRFSRRIRFQFAEFPVKKRFLSLNETIVQMEDS